MPNRRFVIVPSFLVKSASHDGQSIQMKFIYPLGSFYRALSIAERG